MQGFSRRAFLLVNRNSNSFFPSLSQSTSFSKYSVFGENGNKMSVFTNLRRNLMPRYPFGGPSRIAVPDELISWNVSWDDYSPPMYTTSAILNGKPWADPPIGDPKFRPRFNSIDGGINRASWVGTYSVDARGYPLNPAGRTGMSGRGILGRWGPNRAADCVVSRWQRDNQGEIHIVDERPIMEFIAIQRKDTGELAIPGGMTEPGEVSVETAQREFIEEVFGVDELDEIEPEELRDELEELFSNPRVVKKTYVDDHRNTDNAWIETGLVNYHMTSPMSHFSTMLFEGGSDAKAAFWVEYQPGMNLYASHTALVQDTHEMLFDDWKELDLF